MCGLAAHRENNNQPILKNVVAAEAAVGEVVPAEDPVTSDQILLSTTEDRGWRISYAQPEPTTAAYLNKVDKLRQNMLYCEHTFARARTRPSKEKQMERQLKSAAQRKARLANVQKRMR